MMLVLRQSILSFGSRSIINHAISCIKELLDDKIHEGFVHTSAMKNLFALIEKIQERLKANFSRTNSDPGNEKRPDLS
jgi:hypothetical protein